VDSNPPAVSSTAYTPNGFSRNNLPFAILAFDGISVQLVEELSTSSRRLIGVSLLSAGIRSRARPGAACA
jgi:hypothetical protein